MGVIAVLVHLIFELFAGPYIATIIALLAAVVNYGVAIVVLGGITEEELLGMPKGATLVTLCRRLHLIKGEYIITSMYNGFETGNTIKIQ